MNERPESPAGQRNHNRRRVRKPRAGAIALAAITVVPVPVLLAAHPVSGDRNFGPIVYVPDCATSSSSPPMQLNFIANHEPGEMHRYRWRLDIDGEAVVGGMVELPIAGDIWYMIPNHLYPVIIGAEYRLSVQDGRIPDRLEVETEVIEECDRPGPTIRER